MEVIHQTYLLHLLCNFSRSESVQLEIVREAESMRM